jgi:hypothetical protein
VVPALTIALLIVRYGVIAREHGAQLCADSVTTFQATARRCADAEWTTQTEDS